MVTLAGLEKTPPRALLHVAISFGGDTEKVSVPVGQDLAEMLEHVLSDDPFPQKPGPLIAQVLSLGTRRGGVKLATFRVSKGVSRQDYRYIEIPKTMWLILTRCFQFQSVPSKLPKHILEQLTSNNSFKPKPLRGSA